MLKNYFKTAWRNLVKNMVHSIINITGLWVGLACSLLMLLWVQHELSIDGFHKNGARLYKVYEKEYYNHNVDDNYDTPVPLADEVKKMIPEIEDAIMLQEDNHQATFRVGNKILKVEGTVFADLPANVARKLDYAISWQT